MMGKEMPQKDQQIEDLFLDSIRNNNLNLIILLKHMDNALI
jgi:hypothetical protein